MILKNFICFNVGKYYKRYFGFHILSAGAHYISIFIIKL